MSGTESVARLDHATKRYGPTIALNDVSLDVRRGEVLSLLGPNGAGKTTSVKLMLGLNAPTSGSATLFGGDPRRAANRRRVGAMLQVGKVPETLRVREHIDQFRGYYPFPLSVAEVLDLGGLDGIEDRKFGELSGGQKQRVLFALALCGDPELLFLDEPTLGFDVEVRRAFWKQIRAYVSKGRTVLLTTHYLEEADALADRVVVIDKGVIVADGSPSEIKGRVSGRRIRCVTSVNATEILSMTGVTSVAIDSGRTEIMATEAESVVRELLRRDQSLANLEVGSVGLEDAFLSLIEKSEAA
ncbi:MAG: ABC transporter ATP-binding protein [Gemmatimonadales bacterium]